MKAEEIKAIGWHTEIVPSEETGEGRFPEVGYLLEEARRLVEPSKVHERTFGIEYTGSSWSLEGASEARLDKLSFDSEDRDFAYTTSAANFPDVITDEDCLTWTIQLLEQLTPFHDWAEDLAKELEAKLGLATHRLPFFTSIHTAQLCFLLHVARTNYPNGYASLSVTLSISPTRF